MFEALFYGLAVFFLGWQVGTIITGFQVAYRLHTKVTVGLLPTYLGLVSLGLALLV